MKTPCDFLFPEIRGEELFDAVMCQDEGEIYLKEVDTGTVYVVDEGHFKDVLAEMPRDWEVGIMMPDGSIAKITRMQ
jgi:hypothetical protein